MWIALESADILFAITGPEQAAVVSAALGSGQGDPTNDIIYEVTREIRARVTACRLNDEGEGITIPDELKGTALDMCVWRLCKRLPTKVLINEDRNRAYENALKLLEDVARCQFRIEQPATPSTEVLASFVPTIRGRKPRFTRRDEDGI